MKHQLMHPAFPDIVGESALETPPPLGSGCANDNGGDYADDLADPLFDAMAKLEIAATRLW